MSTVAELVSFMENHESKEKTSSIEPGMGLDDLSQAFQLFSQSTAKMEAMYESLEKRVAELTEELENKNKELEQANRLASLGELSAGVAHEIRNPLAGIELSASLLKRTLSGEERQADLIDNIVFSVGRINNIVMNLLTFARGAKIESRPIDVKKVLNEAVLALSMDSKYSEAKIDLLSQDFIPSVLGDAGQLRQVFINLFQNAVDAMGGIGEVKVRLEINEGAQEHKSIGISITDTGVGMSADTMDKIFNPFYTTKDMGTGLGMAISYRIIENHNGKVSIKSKEGLGTTFTIELPFISE